MQHIMIIEDETNIREELMLLLESVPYRVSAPKPEGDLLTLIREARPDLILLDLGLPGIDGLTLCSLLRKESAVPIIFVTGRNTSMDELNCLLRGGDDFLSKPYQPAILLARISAVLRRTKREEDAALHWKNLKLDLASGTISLPEGKSHPAELSRNELKILYYLMKHAGKIVSREELVDYLWDEEIY